MKEKRLFFIKKFETQINNFIFTQTYFLIAWSQIFKNDAILTNHVSFFRKKDSLQLDRFQFLKMNSLMAEIIL